MSPRRLALVLTAVLGSGLALVPGAALEPGAPAHSEVSVAHSDVRSASLAHSDVRSASLAQPDTPLPPVTTPDTSDCPNQDKPPPPVDTSEVPPPGQPTPDPLPVPDEPIGGEDLGECGLVVPDDASAPPAGITAASWLVADLGAREVLAAKDPHGRHRPASIIKLMTALLTVENLKPEQVVVGTHEDANAEGTKVGIGPGGVYTVRQLLGGLLLHSGNDIAHALAGALGGVPETLEMMNERAKELGALDFRAATPSGLDGPGMSVSAYDMALITRAVVDKPILREILQTRQIDFPGFGTTPGFKVDNDNRLLGTYPGAVGGKTGFTDDARHTYVGIAVRGARVLCVVLLRGEQRPEPMYVQGAKLLDYGFSLRGKSVGRLVTGPPTDSADLTSGLRRGTDPTVIGDSAAADTGEDDGTGFWTVVGWLALGGALVAGLVVVVRRTREEAE